MERLTSVNINVTDGSLSPLLWLRGWQPSLSPGPLKSQIYYGGILTGKQLPWSAVLTSKSRIWNLWFSVNTNVPTLSSLHLWITVGTELQNWASPWNELCSTKSGSAKLQKKISFIHLLVSHSRPTYWISIRISFVLFWKLLNHSAANTNLAFQSINCCYFCCYWSLLDRVLVLRSKSVYWCFSLLSILMFFQHLI